MKYLLVPAILAFLPATLFAADRLSVEASIYSARAGTKLTHEAQKLDSAKSVSRKTTRATTTAGKPVRLNVTREFLIGPNIAGTMKRVPVGVTVHLTPRLHGNQVTYTTQLEIREFLGFNNPRNLPRRKFTAASSTGLAFGTREIYLTSTARLGEAGWLFVPAQEGSQALAIQIKISREDA